ncbi:glycosyltransferase [Enterococcus sp. BWT-B8]|uniref:glycosyltransferase n=1 Tax=Enterococcus sp. BWT-B8 TaxID=2885157 RepID=UPI001E45C2ED|nr:glycosyltransferase [Enterococcus sp. BWT-B8]MCB5951540.1 glycosyltransferase [Enterococcus sp. BWT-B8]
MNLETLIITMNQTDISKYHEMNVEGNAIISNQSKKINGLFTEKYGNASIKFLSLDTLGVGRNRNQALLLSSADIIIFADDDLVFSKGYAKKIIEDFKNENIDMMIYSMIFTKKGSEVKRRVNKDIRIRKWNSLKFGATSIAVRRNSLLKNNIWFSLLFGGGTSYGSGEDSIFIIDCLRKGLKIYSSSYILGSCSQDTSSWFTGYNEKFFFDKGVLFKQVFPKFYLAVIIRFVIKHRKLYCKNISSYKAFRVMLDGVREFKN